jgi:hypothetical protein
MPMDGHRREARMARNAAARAAAPGGGAPVLLPPGKKPINPGDNGNGGVVGPLGSGGPGGLMPPGKKPYDIPGGGGNGGFGGGLIVPGRKPIDLPGGGVLPRNPGDPLPPPVGGGPRNGNGGVVGPMGRQPGGILPPGRKPIDLGNGGVVGPRNPGAPVPPPAGGVVPPNGNGGVVGPRGPGAALPPPVGGGGQGNGNGGVVAPRLPVPPPLGGPGPAQPRIPSPNGGVVPPSLSGGPGPAQVVPPGAPAAGTAAARMAAAGIVAPGGASTFNMSVGAGGGSPTMSGSGARVPGEKRAENVRNGTATKQPPSGGGGNGGLYVDPVTGLTGTAAGHASWQNYAGGGLGIPTNEVASWTSSVGGKQQSFAGGSSGPGFKNVAEPDPNAEQYAGDFFSRYKDLLATEDEPNTVDTGRLITTSNARIADQAAGAAEAGKLRGAMLGGGAERGAFFQEKVADRAGAAMASNAANIELEQQRAQDARNDRRRAEANAFFLGGGGAVRMPSDIALAKQGLAVTQANSEAAINRGNDTFNDDLAQFIAISKLFPSGAGGASGGGSFAAPSPYTPPRSTGSGIIGRHKSYGGGSGGARIF